MTHTYTHTRARTDATHTHTHTHTHGSPQLYDPSVGRAKGLTVTRACVCVCVCVCPLPGKYTLPEGGLSGLQTQKVLSGMQERGATCCVYEPSLAVIGRRQNLWTEVNVLVHTVLPQPSKTGLLTEEQRLERLAELTSMLDAAEKLQNPATQVSHTHTHTHTHTHSHTYIHAHTHTPSSSTLVFALR